MAFQCDVPASPTVQQDDETVRITRWEFPPGAVTGWRQRGWPYFVVLLTDAKMHIHDGRKVVEAIFPAGQSYCAPPASRMT